MAPRSTRFLRVTALGLPLGAALSLVGCDAALDRSPSATPLPATSNDSTERTQSAGEWPGWRGVNASGVSSDKHLPIAWGIGEGIRWRAEIPGEGNSSPVVAHNLVFLTSAVDPAPQVLMLWALDRQTGKVVWQAEAGTARGTTHVKNGYASASVATNSQRVFVSFGSAGLFAFDLAGRQLWQRALGPLDHIWGAASSPVLYRDLVIQLCDCQDESCIVAFDQATGEPAWRTPRDSHGCWTTPVFVEVLAKAGGTSSGRTEMIVNGTGTTDGSNGWVIAYDPADGRELWRVRGTTDIVCPTALVAGDLVISTSGRNGPAIAIRPGGSGDVTPTHVVWKIRRGGPYVPTGVAYRNRLYLVTDGGVLGCFNAGDGTPIWQERLKGAFTASLIAGDGRIYALSERGTVYVVAADDTFQLLAENEMGERSLATPAVAEGDLLLRTERHLYCIAAQQPATASAAAEAVDDGEIVAGEPQSPAPAVSAVEAAR